jgi:RimJ/RimL family protein N-acetyltransferase
MAPPSRRPYRSRWPSDRPLYAGHVTELSDGTIALRPLREDDVPAIYEACQDPLIPRFTRVPSPYTMEHAAGALHADEGEIRRAIAGADDRLLGVCGLMRFAPDGRACEVGYWLAPWGRGRGAATRAVELICEWGFATLGLERIELHAHTENAASRAVADRAGFTEFGRRVDPDDGRELVLYARSSSSA